jgi:hypothetical protein
LWWVRHDRATFVVVLWVVVVVVVVLDGAPGDELIGVELIGGCALIGGCTLIGGAELSAGPDDIDCAKTGAAEIARAAAARMILSFM